MIFSLVVKPIVLNYTDRGSYATVPISRSNRIQHSNSNAGLFAASGIAADLRYSGGATKTLPLSLQDNEGANITVGISPPRANGHDFDKIGTGGFNTTNYPKYYLR